MEPINQCTLCQKSDGISESFFANDTATISCRYCGKFRMVGDLTRQIGNTRLSDFHIYAGAVKELNERGQVPTIDDLEMLLTLVRVPRNPLEMMDRVLMRLKRTQTKAGDATTFSGADYSVAYAHDDIEFAYIIDQMRKIGYIRDFGSGYDCLIENHGWVRLLELEKTVPRGDQAFVAMRFHDDLEAAWTLGIEPALKSTGYVPLRIDKTEHDEKIDDQIIAGIRSSSLLAADFTQQSQGVYFEAGFAMGLGIHVIRCCKDDGEEVKKLHFDTRQYNHILWKDPSDLKTKLVNRINATAPIQKPSP